MTRHPMSHVNQTDATRKGQKLKIFLVEFISQIFLKRLKYIKKIDGEVVRRDDGDAVLTVDSGWGRRGQRRAKEEDYRGCEEEVTVM
jgi:hypothetical protein